MFFYKTNGCFSTILAILSISYVSALRCQELVGGYETHDPDFNYHVAVMGKRHFDREYFQICSGAIISKQHVLSAAHCFLNGRGDLLDLIFLIRAAASFLSDLWRFDTEVVTVYVPGLDRFFTKHDLAIAAVKISFDSAHELLKILEIPGVHGNFYNLIGQVTGFGLRKIETLIDLTEDAKVFTKGILNTRLNFGYVKIVGTLNENRCSDFYPFLLDSAQFCGYMIPIHLTAKAGLCAGDGGSPLVINKTLIGIASRHPINCGDTVIASIYTKVSDYERYIKAVLSGNPPPDTLVLPIRIYTVPKEEDGEVSCKLTL